MCVWLCGVDVDVDVLVVDVACVGSVGWWVPGGSGRGGGWWWMLGWMSKEALSFSLPLSWDCGFSHGIDWEVRSVSSVRSVGMAVALGPERGKLARVEMEQGWNYRTSFPQTPRCLHHPEQPGLGGTGWGGWGAKFEV